MRIYLSNTQPSDTSYTWISDLNTLDLLVENCEATDLIVDNILGNFKFEEIGDVIKKIMSKMRIGSQVTFYQLDFDLLSHHYNKGLIGIHDVNTCLFAGNSKSSVFNMVDICNLMSDYLKIESKDFSNDNFQCIVTARRPNGRNEV
tara:strand:- start:2828 stop:3265 length:438 start_codon:yes stop_codon:yes gene_type:complete